MHPGWNLFIAVFIAGIVAVTSTFASVAGLPKIAGQNLVDGKPYTYQLASGKKGTAVVFLSSKCGCAVSHLPHLAQLVKEFPEFSFVGVNSNSDEELAYAKEVFKTTPPGFAVVRDEGSKLANHFGAVKTPHVFLLDSKGKVVFSGGVTNSSAAAMAKKFYLRDSLLAMRNGNEPDPATARALGCEIKR